jgi:hypothetical protein
MNCFIKNIFERKKENPELVHLIFQKFSRGKFEERAMIRVKNSAGKFSLATTPEFAGDLVRMLAEKLGEEKSFVSGAVVSALGLEGFDYKEKKSAIGINKYLIEKEMSGRDILDLADKTKKAFLGLSFKFGEYDLKIQAKSPKSTKGSSSTKKSDEKAKIDFCKLKTSDKELIRNFLFDEELKELNFKEAEIRHDFIIDEIVVPEELKQEKDFALVREKARRKGRIIRRIKVDGKELVKETDFEV